jgi:hypothetical protein
VRQANDLAVSAGRLIKFSRAAGRRCPRPQPQQRQHRCLVSVDAVRGHPHRRPCHHGHALVAWDHDAATCAAVGRRPAAPQQPLRRLPSSSTLPTRHDLIQPKSPVTRTSGPSLGSHRRIFFSPPAPSCWVDRAAALTRGCCLLAKQRSVRPIVRVRLASRADFRCAGPMRQPGDLAEAPAARSTGEARTSTAECRVHGPGVAERGSYRLVWRRRCCLPAPTLSAGRVKVSRSGLWRFIVFDCSANGSSPDRRSSRF